MRIGWIALLVSLIGCSERQDTFDANAYLTRVARVLNMDVPVISATYVPRMQPKPRPPSDTRIALTDALKLGPCGLVPLIAERNSSLGRQKAASQQFLYEWSLAVGLDDCLAQAEGNSDWLRTARAKKIGDREAALWNLLFASETSDALQSSLDSGDASLADAWHRYQLAFVEVRRSALLGLEGHSIPSSEQQSTFEQHIQALETTRFHGQLRRALLDTYRLVSVITPMQQQHITRNTLCPLGKPTEQGRRVQGMLTTYFATEVQPHIAAIRRYQIELYALWQPLANSLDLPRPLDARMDHLLQLPPGTNAAYAEALMTHIAQWQEILSGCQLSVALATTKTND